MKALIIEDSRLAREGLQKLLDAHSQIELVGAAEDGDSASEIIATCRPELLFLDINMPGKSGFDLLESLDYEPKIIFTTAHSEYAIKSFDFDTVDYLLKPISPKRLKQAIAKLFSAGRVQATTSERLNMRSQIFLKDGDKCHLVTLEDIRYFESCKNYAIAYFNEEKAFIKKSLNTIEARLPVEHFTRANRQYIINLNAVESITEWVNDGFRVTLSDNSEIEISRRNAADLRYRLSL